MILYLEIILQGNVTILCEISMTLEPIILQGFSFKHFGILKSLQLAALSSNLKNTLTRALPGSFLIVWRYYLSVLTSLLEVLGVSLSLLSNISFIAQLTLNVFIEIDLG